MSKKDKKNRDHRKKVAPAVIKAEGPQVNAKNPAQAAGREAAVP
jgi:hypothetical protein